MFSPLMMKSTMLLLAVALTSVVAGDRLDQLRLICADDKKAELTRASELPDLVSAAESHQDEAVCSKRTRAALIDLNFLVHLSRDNICSPAHIDRIRAYYNKHVDKSNNRRKEDQLPRALKDFFLSYGFGVSRVCKTSLIGSLLSDGQAMLDTADWNQISAFTSDNGPLAGIVKAPKDVDDILLPRELAVLLLEKNRYTVEDFAGQQVNGSVVFPSRAAQSVKEVQSLCSRKFEPIYSELVLPLISLSRIGLNYKGDDISSQLKDFKSNKNIHRWYRIVYLCELVRMIEVFEYREEATDDGDKRVVRVLTSDEADQMRLKQPAGEIIGDKIDFQLATRPKLAELIVDKEDKSMRNLVSKFDDHKTELRRLSSKIVRQTLTLFKQFLKQSNLKLMGGFLKRGPSSGFNDQLEKLANNYISQLTEQENTPEQSHVIKKRELSIGSKLIIFVVCVVLVLALVTSPIWGPALG